MDQNDLEVDALMGIIALLKRFPKSEQERIFQAAATFLDLRNLRRDEAISALPKTLTVEETAPAGAFSENRAISPKEFLREKSPRTDVDRVACLGYYLATYRNLPHFKTLDISSLNTEAAHPKFSNAAVAVDNATRAGLFVQAARGSKQISAAGEHYVQTLPDRDAAQAALKNARKPRRQKKPVVRAKT